ncbi:MAG TPA: glycyl-radical enzyme activating protein, partial [Armatimonadota bacterium]
MQRYSLHDGPGIRTTVFLKGCPLRCFWCHNPESQATSPELSFSASRCVRCGECARACPNAAVRLLGEMPETDRGRCIVCGACWDACPTGARAGLGTRMTPQEVLAEVERDRPFYEESGGGVTFSGGEPLSQPRFVLNCLRECRLRGYHTAVDTSGFAPELVVRQVAELADLFLFDVKCLDEARHREATGAPLAPILSNLRLLAELGRPVWLRVPVVPGVNDDEGFARALVDLTRTLPGHLPVYLLPCHDLG